MDKAQKELLKSYFHSRAIAREQNKFLYGYKKHEMSYGLKNDLIKIKDIDNLTALERAAYYNTKLRDDKFELVGEFKYGNGNISLAKSNDDNEVFINIEGKPSVEGIAENEIDEMSNHERAAYYNTKLGNDKFINVYNFKITNNNIAVASLKDGTIILINREGEPSVEGITKDEINEMNSYEVAAYYNTKLRTNKFRGIYGFDFANGNLAVAELKDGRYILINRDGQSSVEGITDEDINKMSLSQRAGYLNTKLGDDKFKEVDKFEYANGNLAVAKLKDGTYILVNKEGQPSVEGITKNDISNWWGAGYKRAAYYNSKLKTNIFKDISNFRSGNYNLALAKLKNDIPIFINKEGQPSVEGITEKEMSMMNSLGITAYYNSKLGTDKFKHIYGFIFANGNIAHAKLKNGSYVYINKNGEIVNYNG